MTDPCTAKALTADKTKAKKRQDTPQEIVVSSGRVVKRPKRDFGETWQSVVSPRRTCKAVFPIKFPKKGDLY